MIFGTPATHSAVAAALCATVAAAACGKKGAPIAPIVRIPAAVDQIAASRLGSDVYVTLTVPTMNVDDSLPADVGRIDVYGYTGRAAPLKSQWTGLAEVVASIPVAPPPPLGQPAPVATSGTVDASVARQGMSVTILDRLTPEELTQGPVPLVTESSRRPRPDVVDATPAGPLRRFYLAIPLSERGRPGPLGAEAGFPLITLPEPPSAVRATYAAAAVSLTWEPAGGLLGFLLDRPLPVEPSPLGALSLPAGPRSAVIDTGVPPGPTRYDVYRELAPDPFALPPPAEATPVVTPPVPLTPAPIAAVALLDGVEFGRQRCYHVRALRGAGESLVVSDPSKRTCVTPVDVFPPATPAGLATVPSEGAISLLWEPNSDVDLGGYLVLRGEVGDATLRPLTDTPIVDARFRDTAVQPGRRYVYAVVAVDSQLPLPNVSAVSAQVEETAR